MLYFPRVEMFSFLVECCPVSDSDLSHGPSVHTVLNASGHTLLLKSLSGLISPDDLIKTPGRGKTVNCVFLVTLIYNLVMLYLSIIH